MGHTRLSALAGKVVVITGGSSGIGRATAGLCARRGAHVVIGDIDETRGANTAGIIQEAGGSATFVRTDVTREDDCQSLMQRTMEIQGQLDILITSAGILQGAYIDVAEFDLEIFERVQHVNVRGTFLAMKHAVITMGQRGGTILLLASPAGVTGGSSSIAYGTSKAAVHGLGLVAKDHIGSRPIRVNTVCPGSISTPLKHTNVADTGRAHGHSTAKIAAAQQALFSPEGVARVLAFLASDEASYVQGAVFTK